MGDMSGDKTRVIVIGAGASGLAAAADLHARGIDVIVIEGRDRIGGRVWSHKDTGVTLELGAAWLTGIRGNPITEIVSGNGIATTPTDYEAVHLHDADGKRIPDAEAEKLQDQYDELWDSAEKIAEDGGEVITVERAIQRALDGEQLTPEEQRALNWMVGYHMELPWGVDASELALREEPDEYPGGDALFPGGFVQIVQALARGVTVRLSEVVRRIEARDDGVRVETDKGVHEAEHAIVTLPLGVLKKGSVTFSPPLPARKLGAIDRLAMGAVNRICLVFPRAFWPKEPHFFGYMSAHRGELPAFLNLQQALGAPALMGFVTGRYNREIADLPDSEVQASVMKVLRSMFGAGIPSPTHMVRTHWERDPFTWGSYAHIPVGAERADLDILAEPAGRLLFAGEATHGEQNGTVHGAILSGRREARRITG